MQPQAKTIIDLERKFWQSLVDNDTDVALGMLAEPSLMVSSHGAMSFDHAKYREMAEHGTFSRGELDRLMDMATAGIVALDAGQRAALAGTPSRSA